MSSSGVAEWVARHRGLFVNSEADSFSKSEVIRA